MFNRHIKEHTILVIIADEATDVSGTEQLSVSIQWVSESYKSMRTHLVLKYYLTPRLQLSFLHQLFNVEAKHIMMGPAI